MFAEPHGLPPAEFAQAVVVLGGEGGLAVTDQIEGSHAGGRIREFGGALQPT